MAGLRDMLKKRMDAISNAGAEKAAPSPAATTVATPAKAAPAKDNKTVISEAESKAARFKWERENPGVPYVEKKADGGLVGVRNQMGESWRQQAQNKLQRRFNKTLRKMADGGKVKQYQGGGKITGKGGPTEDKQPILASPGEYILPADTTAALGVRNLDNLVAQTHTPVHGAKGMANGTLVDDFGNLVDEQGRPVRPTPAGPTTAQTVRSSVGGATNTAKDVLAKGVRGVRDRLATMTAPAPSPMTEYNAWKDGAGTYERVGGQAVRNQPMTPSTIDRKVFGPTQPVTATPQPGPGFNPNNVRQPGLLERMRTEQLARGADTVRGAGRAMLRGAAALAPVATFAQGMEPTDLSEPAEANRLPGVRGDFALQANPKLSEGERNQLVAEINSGDPARAEAARLKLLGANPQKYNPNVELVPASARGPWDPAASVARAPEVQGAAAQPPAQPQPVSAPPIGIRDTTSQDVLRDDMDNRARWTSEAQAIDERMRQRNTDDMARRRGMVAQGEYAAAKNEYDIANSENNRKLNPGRFRAAERQLAGVRATQQNQAALDNDAEKTRQTLEAARRRDEAGLRGNMYQADKQLEGTRYTADVNARRTAAEMKVKMLEMRQKMGEKNAEDLDKLISTRLQVFTTDKDGKQVPDQAGTFARQEAFRRFMTTPTAQDKKVLQSIAPGAESIDDVPKHLWSVVMDRFNAGMQVNQNAPSFNGDTPQGPPSRITAGERGLRDSFPGDGVNSDVGALSTVINNLNPFAPPERNFTAKVETPGSMPQLRTLEDLTKVSPDQRMAVVAQLEQSGDPKSIQIAAKLRERWNVK